MATVPRLHESVAEHVRRDFLLLRDDMTVERALRVIRERGVGERIIYFYVVDAQERLAGVLPTRRLLTSAPEVPLAEIMVRRVVAVPQTASLLDACELFVLYKFFAFPVVDVERRVVGVLDVGVFTEEVLDLTEPEVVSDTFEMLGFQVAQARGASPWKAFRLRFPWLLSTIAAGMTGAFLAGAFEATLQRVVLVSFFLALVLALGESVSMQTMTLTIQALRAARPDWSWFLRAARHEIGTGLLIGASAGLVVFLVTTVWRREPAAAAVVAGSVAGSVTIASLAGLAIPTLLHSCKLDPKIAAGPITLGVTDVLTLLLYFSLAAWLL